MVSLDLRAQLYVRKAFEIFNGTPDFDHLSNAKALDNVPEIATNFAWINFVAAVSHENNLLIGGLDPKIVAIYEELKDARHQILKEMFRDYGLIK